MVCVIVLPSWRCLMTEPEQCSNIYQGCVLRNQVIIVAILPKALDNHILLKRCTTSRVEALRCAAARGHSRGLLWRPGAMVMPPEAVAIQLDEHGQHDRHLPEITIAFSTRTIFYPADHESTWLARANTDIFGEARLLGLGWCHAFAHIGAIAYPTTKIPRPPDLSNTDGDATIRRALFDFLKDVATSSQNTRIVAHGLGFHAGVIAHEAQRYGLPRELRESWQRFALHGYCTLNQSLHRWVRLHRGDRPGGPPLELKEIAPSIWPGWRWPWQSNQSRSLGQEAWMTYKTHSALLDHVRAARYFEEDGVGWGEICVSARSWPTQRLLHMAVLKNNPHVCPMSSMAHFPNFIKVITALLEDLPQGLEIPAHPKGMGGCHCCHATVCSACQLFGRTCSCGAMDMRHENRQTTCLYACDEEA